MKITLRNNFLKQRNKKIILRNNFLKQRKILATQR